jgi:hypothetical protein
VESGLKISKIPDFTRHPGVKKERRQARVKSRLGKHGGIVQLQT